MDSMNPLLPGRWVTVALACLVAVTAYAAEPSKVAVPQSENPFLRAVATLYEQGKYEEALSKLEKALESKSNGVQEVLWLKLMKGVLQVELAQGAPLDSFKEALAMDEQAQLPVDGTRRLRKLFEQARNTIGLPADQEILAEELGPEPGAVVEVGPPPRSQGLSVSVRGEADVLGFSVTPAFAPVVGVGYTKEKLGGALRVVVQDSPGLRAEGQLHPRTLGWVRPYMGLGATAFFREKDAQGATTLFGGVSGRAVLGVDVQWNARMYAFADVAYEHFLVGAERYRSQSVLFSVGVGVFP
jgi:tetratricopeptide (TPR) repeat protein